MSVPEYTIAATGAALVTVAMDRWAPGTRVLEDRRMPVVGGLVLFFMLLVNGWLTWRPVVVYDDGFRALPRLGSIPVEDFLYGFALVIQSLIWWEVAKRQRPPGRRHPASAALTRRRAA